MRKRLANLRTFAHTARGICRADFCKQALAARYGSRNVFEDIDVPNAEEHLVKAHLVFKIDTIMKNRTLKQVEAAELFRIRQPDIQGCCAVNSGSFPLSAFLRFLVALNQDVEIAIKPHRDRNNAPALHVP